MERAHSFFRMAYPGKNSWVFYLLGFIFMIAGNTILSLPIIVIGVIKGMQNDNFDEIMEQMQANDFSGLELHPAFNLALMLLPFLGLILGLWACLRFLQNRDFISVINPFKKFDWGRFFTGAGIWMVLMALLEIVFYIKSPENYVWQFDAGKFFPLLFVALLLIPIQASAEELVLRGWLMQGLGLWIKRIWPPVLISSLLFGLMHGLNPEVAKFGQWILLYYIGVGLHAALVTVMDERLELAMGLHSANNVYGALLVTFSSSALSTPALFKINEYEAVGMTLGWVVCAVIFFVVVARIYKWTDYGKLTRPIDVTPDVIADIGNNEPEVG